MRKRIVAQIKKMRLAEVFLLSAVLFWIGDLCGAYKREIVSLSWYFVFYIFEFLFWMGLNSRKIAIKKHFGNRQAVKFEISKNGNIILLVFNFIAVLSFVYFLVLYIKVVGISKLGTYTTDLFNARRSSLEKITLLLMQLGGECAYLILFCDSKVRRTKRFILAEICLFLPGIRSLILGNRYTIAVEYCLYFLTSVERDFEERKKRKVKKFVTLFLGIGILICFLILFSTRTKYVAFDRYEFHKGDMVVKDLWSRLYYLTKGRIGVFMTLSDYISEAPYVFAYFCEYQMPKEIFYGRFTFRSVYQILYSLFGLGTSYEQVATAIAGGKYSGIGYILIADFGKIGAPFMAFLIGMIFSEIEKRKINNAACCALYPLIKVICIFAPIYYFYVGRCDYPFLFTLILAPFFLRKINCIDYQIG